jgi:hypothetical protein
MQMMLLQQYQLKGTKFPFCIFAYLKYSRSKRESSLTMGHLMYFLVLSLLGMTLVASPSVFV